ncbi:MAG: FG-GAP-like repeat-containing protein [Polyangiales bacterium]
MNTPVRYVDEKITGATTVADFDGDRRPDVLVIWDGEAAPSLWLNQGGRFTDVGAAWGLGDLREVNSAAAADLDGDGDPDLMLHSRRLPGIQIYRNLGLRFEYAGSVGGRDDFTAIVPVDLDGDGDLDLSAGATARPGNCPRLFINGCPAGAQAWRQTSPWTFTAVPVLAAPRRALAVRWYDLDRDDRDELLVIADFGMLNGGNQVLRLEGHGENVLLREVPPPRGFDVEIFGMGIAPIDIDRDGQDELLITNFGRNVLLQARDGVWDDIAVRAGADAYGQLVPDVTPHWNPLDPEHVWMGPMDRFEARYLDRESGLMPTTKWTPLVFDFDHDGRDDVFVSASATGLGDLFPEPLRQSGALLRGVGTTLRDDTDRLGVGEAHGAAHPSAADFDGDGDLDLALPRSAYADAPGGLTLLRNDATTGNALWIEARGLGGASDGIGAQVRVVVGGRTITRRLDGNYSIAGSGPHGVHVGLGAARTAERVEVVFVSGARRTLTNVPAGRVVVTE